MLGGGYSGVAVFLFQPCLVRAFRARLPPPASRSHAQASIIRRIMASAPLEPESTGPAAHHEHHELPCGRDEFHSSQVPALHAETAAKVVYESAASKPPKKDAAAGLGGVVILAEHQHFGKGVTRAPKPPANLRQARKATDQREHPGQPFKKPGQAESATAPSPGCTDIVRI